MKKLLSSLLFIVLSTSFFAQIDQTVISGKTVFIYPHQEEVSSYEQYYYYYADQREVLKRDEKNRNVVSVKLVPISKKAKNSQLGKSFKSKKFLKEFGKFLEKEAFYMSNVEPGLNKDITPALEALPDGDYVQYFRDVPYIKDRVLRYKNDLVSARFSVKNNQIDGVANWYYPDGKLRKSGNYVNGSKNGSWVGISYRQRYFSSEEFEKRPEKELDKLEPIFDTSRTEIEYSNGLRNGVFLEKFNQRILTSGNYKNDEESGAWERYGFKEISKKNPKGVWETTTTDELILMEQFTYRMDEQRGKSVIVRTEIVPYDFIYNNTDTSLQFTITESGEYDAATQFEDFGRFYSILAEEESIELPSEEVNSFEGEYEGDYDLGYGGDYGMDGVYEMDENGFNPEEHYIFVNKKRYTSNELIDSMGYLFRYEGRFRKFYPNGQVQYDFEVKNGVLVSETPVYWENGQIANQVVFDADSNQYVEQFFDVRGKCYKTKKYLKNGNAIRQNVDLNSKFLSINNKKYFREFGSPIVEFNDSKLLIKGVESKVLLLEKLWKADSTIASTGTFEPETRTYTMSESNFGKGDYYKEETVFSEEYTTVNSNQTLQYKNIQLNTIVNGALDDYWKSFIKDTISPQSVVYGWYYKFQSEDDRILSVNQKPFSGQFKVVGFSKNFSVKASDSKIALVLPTQKRDLKLATQAIKNYQKTQRPNDWVNALVPDLGGSIMISHSVLSLFPFMGGAFSQPYGNQDYGFDQNNLNYENEYYDGEMKRNKKNKRSFYKSLNGSFLNGKPEGSWQIKDQNGKVRSSVFYKNGLMDGTNQYFDVEYPKPKKKKSELDYDYDIPAALRQEFPKKKTYYLSQSVSVKNGNLNGYSYEFNWKGDTTSQSYYEDGIQTGTSYKRNPFFYSESQYENGYIDGITKTYFLPPKKDSVLIFVLSFQNGSLQGESKAFHANGNIAKKGFFLNGQPIDDYEAYDTLGFRYQYVKFLFGQPIEEKIWEENQLSVRYDFDWRDSIYFDARDITESSSIDRLINSLGYQNNALKMPYFGRPSLVRKTNIDYNMTKYYPNDTIAREGQISKGKKVGCWKYYNYEGVKLMEVDYFDSILKINDSIQFKSKGELTYLDSEGNELSKHLIIEKFEKYDCAHTDHNEERMLYAFWEKDSSQHRINGYTKNYYDNGSLQNEGYVKNGLPTGIWKMYDVDGNLSHLGVYKLGKRDGRWLQGDLGNIKNMSEICLNPNLENLEEIMNYQEKLLDITVIYYTLGKQLRKEYFGINLNNEAPPEGFEGDDLEFYEE